MPHDEEDGEEDLRPGSEIAIFGGARVGQNVESPASLYDKGTSKLRPGTTTQMIIRIIYDRCKWLTDVDYMLVRDYAELSLQISAFYEAYASPEAAASGILGFAERHKASVEIRNLRRLRAEIGDRLMLDSLSRKENDLKTGAASTDTREEEEYRID